MVEIRNILLFFSSTILFLKINAECLRANPCFCQINENEKIDISRVLEEVTYLNDTIGKTTYTFLGCKDVNYTYPYPNSTTIGPGVLLRGILENDTIINSTILGTANQIKFTKDDKNYLITFVNGSDTKNIQPSITLLCDNINQPFLKLIDDLNKSLVLSSPRVCILTEHHGMSGGSVFLLILFIVASIYIIGGAALLYFIRGARGVEMIPNIEFWKNLPGLVKDGAIFLLSGCRPNFVTTAETYDRI
ncbi:unnamed protein product [Psylliodes chrysocephalus]|uniref:Cation-dependent mannose-6-phosphate receptor n=1 Tax=Psylliodes chrysocephalus TaxID=3402493 RepID=A0A9P0GH90_9CUCU|nr:unnamed protein product [Psylliodes chrysocephala]